MRIRLSEITASENMLNIFDCGVVVKLVEDFSYIYANQYGLEVTKLKQKEFLGCSDYELPWDMYADSYISHDKDVLQRYTTIDALFLARDSQGNKFIVHDKKSPLFDDNNNPIGTLGVFKPIQGNFVEMLSYMSKLGQDNLKICHYLQNSPKEFNSQRRLTKRESVCLFYTLQGYTAKQVAEFTNTSAKTVEFHLANIRLKWNCYTKQDLLGKANEYGCFNVLPIDLFLG